MIKETFGVNEAGIDVLVLNIYEIAEKINANLNSIDELVLGTANYFKCEEANLYRQEFNKVKSLFPRVNENILSYAEEILLAKKNFQTVSSKVAVDLNYSANNINIKSNK